MAVLVVVALPLDVAAAVWLAVEVGVVVAAEVEPLALDVLAPVLPRVVEVVEEPVWAGEICILEFLSNPPHCTPS